MDRNNTFKFAALGVVTLSLSGCNLLPGNTQQSTGDMTKEAEEMAEAFESGAAVRCNMTGPDGATATYFMKDGKMRVEGMQLGDSNTTGYMINDGEYMFTWSEGATEGMKLRIPTEEEVAETAEQAEEYLDQVPDFEDETEVTEWEDQGYTIDCDNDGVTNDLFVPPANINFVDFGAQMEGLLQDVKTNIGDEVEGRLDERMDELDPETQQQLNELMEQTGQ